SLLSFPTRRSSDLLPVVELQELLRVVVVFAHGVGLGRMLVENVDVEKLRPPVLVGGAPALGVHAAHGWGMAVLLHDGNPLLIRCARVRPAPRPASRLVVRKRHKCRRTRETPGPPGRTRSRAGSPPGLRPAAPRWAH